MRRLYALVTNLPDDAALWREVRAAKDEGASGSDSQPTQLATDDLEQVKSWFAQNVGG